MSIIKATFLGTGTSMGVPVVVCECSVCQSTDPHDKRLRASIMVETQGNAFVIDTGPDFRQQMLNAKVKDIDAIIYTHDHSDHVLGMDDVRAFNFFNKKDMPLYATDHVQESIKRVFNYAFKTHKYPGVPEITLHTIDAQPFEINGVKIIPIQVMHHKLPVLGFRFGDFTYITDANYIAPEEKEKIKGSKVLVVNALRREAHISHFTFDQAKELAKEIGAEMTYFTHMSHQLGKHEDINKELPDHIRLAYDGLQITV